MGRTYSHQVSTDRSSEKECCGCRNWSWLLYLLVILALALSVLNFWMSLYRHEEVRHTIDDVRGEINDLSDSLNSTIDGLRLIQIDSEKLRSHAISQTETLKQDIKDLKKSLHHHKRPPIATADNNDEDSKEMVIIKEIKSVHGKLIDELVRKVLGYDSVNAATLEAVNRLQKGFSILEAEAKINRQILQDSNTFNEKIQESFSSHSDEFSRLNVTLHEVRTVMDRLSTGIDVETLRVRAVESQISSLKELLSGIEEDLAIKDETSSRRVERIEQRIDDLEIVEMDIRNDIRRLNNSAFFQDGLPLQEIAALTLNDKNNDLGIIKERLSELETSRSFQPNNFNESLTVHQKQIEEMLDNFERRLTDRNVDDKNLEQKIEKLDSSLKYFAQNLMKMRTLPNELKNLENRINQLQSTILNSDA